MKPNRVTFWWAEHAGLTPALIEACLYTKTAELYGRMNRYKHPVWILDYAFNTAEHYRVASPSRPWQTRLARTMHLYAPGIPRAACGKAKRCRLSEHSNA